MLIANALFVTKITMPYTFVKLSKTYLPTIASLLSKDLNNSHNCLGNDHFTRNCRCVTSCKKCNKRHHTLLHRESTANKSSSQASSKDDANSATSSQTSATARTGLPSLNKEVTTVLMTCQLMVEANGHKQKGRALIDTGSSVSFITSRLANALQAKKIPKITSIVGIQRAQVPNSSHVNLILSRLTGTATSVKMTAVVVDKITSDLPIQKLPNIRQSPVLKGLHLADPDFDLPGRINLLLGMDCYNEIINPQRACARRVTVVILSVCHSFIQQRISKTTAFQALKRCRDREICKVSFDLVFKKKLVDCSRSSYDRCANALPVTPLYRTL